jgi:hypothetical protein
MLGHVAGAAQRFEVVQALIVNRRAAAAAVLMVNGQILRRTAPNAPVAIPFKRSGAVPAEVPDIALHGAVLSAPEPGMLPHAIAMSIAVCAHVTSTAFSTAEVRALGAAAFDASVMVG